MYQAIKPTVLIGSSGVGKTFTKEVVEAMSSFNKVLSAAPYNIFILISDSKNLTVMSVIGL